MTNEDVLNVFKLGQEIFDVSVLPYSTWSLGGVVHHFEQQPEACWLAFDADEIVGFILGSMPFYGRSDWAHIEWIAIKPEYRGRTLASNLARKSIDALYAAGATQVVADIATSNRHSQLLARALGCTEITNVSLFAVPRQAPDPVEECSPNDVRAIDESYELETAPM